MICRPPRNRPNPRLINLPVSGETAATPALVAVYEKTLIEAGRLGTPDGAHVMHLAELFANGQHTAAGAASLSRELRAAMETALAGAPRKADAMDELEERRRQKAGSAGA